MLPLLAGFALACTAGPSPQSPLPVPGSRQLRIGDAVPLAGTDYRLRLEELSGDSRCPVDVVCVRAGEVTLQARLVAEPGMGLPDIPVELRSDGATTADGVVLRITAVKPLPHAGVRIPERDYRLTVAVQPKP
jgi:hypothetical protein